MHPTSKPTLSIRSSTHLYTHAPPTSAKLPRHRCRCTAGPRSPSYALPQLQPPYSSAHRPEAQPQAQNKPEAGLCRCRKLSDSLPRLAMPASRLDILVSWDSGCASRVGSPHLVSWRVSGKLHRASYWLVGLGVVSHDCVGIIESSRHFAWGRWMSALDVERFSFLSEFLRAV